MFCNSKTASDLNCKWFNPATYVIVQLNNVKFVVLQVKAMNWHINVLKNRKRYLKHCCHISAVNVWFSAVMYEFMLSVCLIFFAVLIKIKSLST